MAAVVGVLLTWLVIVVSEGRKERVGVAALQLSSGLLSRNYCGKP